MESVTISGVEITKELHPNLYSMAERDPEGLKRWLEDLKERTGSVSLEMTAIMLEMDIEHEKLSTE